MASSAKRTQTIIARRQDLIQGTIKSIASLGYNNSTVQTICEAAGLSRGLIGHYFKGKDDLLTEAFRAHCERADEKMRQAIRAIGEDPLQRLLAATSVTFGSWADREDSLVWHAFCGVAPWNPEMRELHQRLYRRYRLWIERMIARAADERDLEIDARRAAVTYVQMVDGFWMGWIMDQDAYSMEEVTEIVSDWLLALFGEQRAAKKASARTKSQRKPARA